MTTQCTRTGLSVGTACAWVDEDRSDLEERDVLLATLDVPTDRREEPGKQGSAKARLFGGQRIGDDHLRLVEAKQRDLTRRHQRAGPCFRGTHAEHDVPHGGAKCLSLPRCAGLRP